LILVFSFLHPSTTDIYTLSLHDALPIWNSDAPFAQINGAIIHELLARAARLARALVVGSVPGGDAQPFLADAEMLMEPVAAHGRDRKSTRLNSSHVSISYAVFCLKKKKE